MGLGPHPHMVVAIHFFPFQSSQVLNYFPFLFYRRVFFFAFLFATLLS